MFLKSTRFTFFLPDFFIIQVTLFGKEGCFVKTGRRRRAPYYWMAVRV